MKEILIHCGPLQRYAVIVEQGELTDIFVDDTSSGGGVGNIYKGTVDNVVPGMQAAFVNIGLEKNAFLGVDDIASPEKTDIRKLIKKGQDICVQVEKEAQGVKGARVTTSFTLPGHKLVLMPHDHHIGVSKKIVDEEEKKRLKKACTEARLSDLGYIVRTDAVGATVEEIRREMAYLEDRYAKLQKNAKIKNAPALLYDENELLLSMVRDHFDDSVDRLVTDDERALQELSEIVDIMAPHLKDRLQLQEGNLLERYGLANEIKKLLQKKVWLDNGAYLIIDYTEALTVIDVNTGKFTGDYDLNKTILKTNLAAAKEIARQLRLRAIGGIIVIDFIDMEEDEDRQKVLATLEEAGRPDKVKTNILGFAPLGLVELTRKKTRHSLSEAMQCACPYCEGDGRVLNDRTILDHLLQEVRRCAAGKNLPYAVLRLNPYLYKALLPYEALLKELFGELHLYVRQDAGMHIEDFNVNMLPELSDQEGLNKLL